MAEERQRLDKWLCYARFAKTRALAARLVTGGRVRLNGRRVESAAKALVVGDVLTIAAPHVTAVVRLTALPARRGSPAEARTLYEEVGRDDGALASREPAP